MEDYPMQLVHKDGQKKWTFFVTFVEQAASIPAKIVGFRNYALVMGLTAAYNEEVNLSGMAPYTV